MGWLSKILGQKQRAEMPVARVSEWPQPNESAPPASHSDGLALLAQEADRRSEFLAKIVSDGVCILALGPGSVSNAQTPDELLEHIRQQAENLSQDQFGQPYTYLSKGSRVLPIFSTVDAAQQFISRLNLQQATAFQFLQMLGGFWLQNDFGLIRVIFNPFSDCQTELSDSEIERLRSIASRTATGT